ncbi:MAG: DinB family protein [Bacteroidota bacterium]|nr:DinB family protein [Bacteroidota bacterium]
MNSPATLLEETLEYWYEVRKGLIKELQVIPASRIGFRATLETRSVCEILQHVLEVAIATVEELLREDTNFHRAPYPQLLHHYAPNISKADTQEKLVDLLVEQYKDATQRLRSAGSLFMMQFITKPDGTKGTRFAILTDAIAHEMYHRGQLTVYSRLLGLEPALTKLEHQPSVPPLESTE